MCGCIGASFIFVGLPTTAAAPLREYNSARSLTARSAAQTPTCANLASATATETPCCRTCTDFAGTNNWFWQCSLPRTDSSTTATYTFDTIAGQFYYMGKCDVIVSEETVAVQDCIVAPGWTATTVHFYLGKTISTTCAPGQFG